MVEEGEMFYYLLDEDWLNHSRIELAEFPLHTLREARLLLLITAELEAGGVCTRIVDLALHAQLAQDGVKDATDADDCNKGVDKSVD